MMVDLNTCQTQVQADTTCCGTLTGVSVPTFLVAGAAREGTTALINGLKRHPRVFVTVPKEPHYFALHGQRLAFSGPGDQVMINERAVTDEAAYVGLYPEDAGEFEALGEGSTSSLYYYEQAIPEIIRLAPDVKVLVILRDPVARAQSAHDYLISRGYESEPSLLAAVAMEPRRIATGYHHLWHYTAMGRYADALAAYRDALGPERVRVVFDDALRGDPRSVLVPLLRFIGTTPAPGEGDPLEPVNVSGQQRSGLLGHLIRLTNGTPALRRLVQQRTTWEEREQLRRLLLKRRPGVPAEVRNALAPMFADEIERLRVLVPDLTGGAPLPGWLKN